MSEMGDSTGAESTSGMVIDAGHPGIPKSAPALHGVRGLWITKGRVLGELASWAVQQSPYTVPDKLAEAITAFSEQWPRSDCAQFDTMGDLRTTIRATIDLVPEIIAWNERKNGSQSPFSFVTRYEKPSPDDDFIDLDALTQNVTLAVWHDAADFKAFNDDFEARWAARSA